jgi:hypothetical protein
MILWWSIAPPSGPWNPTPRNAGVMRAVEGVTRRTIGLGHGTDGFIRVAEVLGRQ